MITTQPGWAFTVAAELRSRGVSERSRFFHRDSSLLLPFAADLVEESLATPAEVVGSVFVGELGRNEDSTDVISKLLTPALLKQATLEWLPFVRTTRARRYSLVVESYGRTSVRRQDLAARLEETIGEAFSGRTRTSNDGVRFYCKADPEIAVFGVQLQSNLGDQDKKPGALRDHLAAGLLMIADMQPTETVFDPFMGTGTIPEVAAQVFGARSLGLEVDRESFDIASRRIGGAGEVRNHSFNSFDFSTLPSDAKIVSNLPFGEQFHQVPTDRLAGFLERCVDRGKYAVLLMSREQAPAISRGLNLRQKNVLVLGQPASIVYGDARASA